MRNVSMIRPGSVAAVAFAVILSPMAFAVNPSLGEILPRGGQRGTQVEVHFHGGNLADGVEIMAHDPGLSFSNFEVVDNGHVKCLVDISPEAQIGTKALRVRTKSAVSNLRLFSVGSLKEVQEAEPNSDWDTAQAIELNSAINGTVTNEDVDYYAVNLEAGQTLSVEVEAIRLGGVLFDPKVRLFGPGGHERVAEDDTAIAQQDAVFNFTTAEAGPHRVAISESSYGGGGNYRYRLHVGTFPRPLSMTPLGGQPDSQIEVSWLGDPALSKQPITVPAVALGTQPITPSGELGVAPTPMPFRVSNLPGTIETEPNNKTDEATAGQVPGAFDGVINQDGDEDFFSFEGKKDQNFEFRVWARHLGSPLDSVLTLIKPSGGAVASDDDAAGVDSRFTAALPEDGVYYLVVRDHLRRGGETFSYRIEAAPVEPRLTFSLVENEQVSVNVPQGNRTFMLLSPNRENFGGPLDLTWLNLPEGARMEHPPVDGNQNRVPVILHAAATTPVTGALIQIDGKHAAENSSIAGGFEQSVPLTFGRNQTVFCDRVVTEVATSFTEPAPYILEMVQSSSPGIKGANKSITIVAKRADGFEGEISLRWPWLPGGFGGGTAKIPAKQDRTDINLEVRNAAVGTHNLVVEGKAAGYSVCTPFTPVEVAEPYFSVSMPEVSIEQGQSVEVALTFNQAMEYQGEYTLEFHGLPKGVTTEPPTFSHATTGEVKINLAAAADAPPGKHGAPRLAATLTINGEPARHYFGGSQITVFKPLPAELQKEKPKQEKKPDEPERKSRFQTD